MLQLNLQFSNDRDTLGHYLERASGKAVSVTITDNSTSMLSVRTKGNAVFVRLHRMFLHACNDVLNEIAEFIKLRKGRTPLIYKFIRGNRHCLENKYSKPPVIRTEGKYHNLEEMFHSLNEEYFAGRIKASITWGKRNSRWAVRKRTLGSYSDHTNTIRINPVLDKKNVPQYFIKFIVYHEMLHGAIRAERRNGRRVIHSAEFRKRERLFEDYEKAVLWEKKH